MFALRSAVVLSLAFAVSTPALAADAGSPPAPPSFRGDYLVGIDRVEKQTMALEQTMPQPKFNWRPGKGVRSVAEVYLHIAGGIYFFMGQLGHEVPADLQAMMKADKWDTQTTNKDAIKTILTNAFAFLRKSLADTSDADFEKTVKFFGSDASTRLLFLAVQGHCWEHLGQSIAYARTNGVVPPWSKPKAKD